MNSEFYQTVEQLVSTKTGSTARIASTTSVGGGCINNAEVISLSDGLQFFVKSNSVDLADMFRTEALGLAALSKADALRIPSVIGFGKTSDKAFLVLENVKSKRSRAGFFEELGRGLAHIHLSPAGSQFGFDSDNFLGSSHQPNSPTSDWVEFWAEQRLGYQLRLARDNGISNDELQTLGQNLIDRLQALIGQPQEQPALLHGDLWSGNYMSDEHGAPVLIDPAVYWGRREAEFGMTTLFGGFDSRFYDAYQEVAPLADESDERIEIYRLYHLLNHLNLFGSSYLSGCLQILRKFK